jgi:hypothetical protein
MSFIVSVLRNGLILEAVQNVLNVSNLYGVYGHGVYILKKILKIIDGVDIHLLIIAKFIYLSGFYKQGGAVEACRAHNPKVTRSKLVPANIKLILAQLVEHGIVVV